MARAAFRWSSAPIFGPTVSVRTMVNASFPNAVASWFAKRTRMVSTVSSPSGARIVNSFSSPKRVIGGACEPPRAALSCPAVAGWWNCTWISEPPVKSTP